MGETPTKKFEPAPHASGTPATKGEEFGASVDPIPFRLRTAMERAAMVLSNCASSRNRELDEGSQNLLRGVLDELDGACLEANLAVRPVTVEPVAEVYGVTKSFGEGVV